MHSEGMGEIGDRPTGVQYSCSLVEEKVHGASRRQNLEQFLVTFLESPFETKAKT